MLAQETLDAVAVITGITADELAQAISDEQEVKLELPEGRFLTTENEAKLLDNHGKKKYDEGKSKTLKDVFDGKTKDDFLIEFKTNVLAEANLEPNQKLQEKEEILNDLRTKLQNKDNEIERILNEKVERERISNALANMPELRKDLGISKSEALNLILSKSEIKEDGIYSDGKPVTDDYGTPVAIQDFLQSEVKSRGWGKKEIRGNGGRKPGVGGSVPKTYSEFQKVCESNGWNEGSQEAKQYLSKLRSDNADFDLDN